VRTNVGGAELRHMPGIFAQLRINIVPFAEYSDIISWYAAAQRLKISVLWFVSNKNHSQRSDYFGAIC